MIKLESKDCIKIQERLGLVWLAIVQQMCTFETKVRLLRKLRKMLDSVQLVTVQYKKSTT